MSIQNPELKLAPKISWELTWWQTLAVKKEHGMTVTFAAIPKNTITCADTFFWDIVKTVRDDTSYSYTLVRVIRDVAHGRE